MFSHLTAPTLDPIISLTAAYRNDPRKEKVDLGIGVYKNSLGETPIMEAIKQAQEIVANTQKSKSYVGIAGCEEFNHCVADLVIGDTPVRERLSVIQTPGGSGALRMLADLMRVAQPDTTVWLTDPNYVNHKPIMEAAGLKVKYYSYFSRETKMVDTARMLSDLEHAGPKDVVLLHGCCHNPTGADIDFSAWKAVTELANKNGFVPFVDIAYQGFGDGLLEDAQGLRYMAERVEEMLITTSCSKNFGLYRERTGTAMVLAKNETETANAKGKLLTLARTTYTMPPDYGAALVKTVLQSEPLTAIWKKELVGMQQRLLTLRQTLCNQLRNQHNTSQFDFIEKHKGMFTMLGLTSDQMVRLREEFGIYGVADSRINIAGLTEKDIPYVADAIMKVL